LFPGYGHAVLSSGDLCLKEMMSDFYDNPTREPTAECFNQLEVQFAVPDFQ
jgi:hypothetical protein